MIEVAHLTKRFGRLRAVDDLSFTVEQGQAVAFWGANGAGKTTVIRCLLNLIPYEGDITVSGIDVRRNGKQVRQTVGFVPQELNFHDDLTIAETMTARSASGSSCSWTEKRAGTCPELAHVSPLLER